MFFFIPGGISDHSVSDRLQLPRSGRAECHRHGPDSSRGRPGARGGGASAGEATAARAASHRQPDQQSAAPAPQQAANTRRSRQELPRPPQTLLQPGEIPSPRAPPPLRQGPAKAVESSLQVPQRNAADPTRQPLQLHLQQAPAQTAAHLCRVDQNDRGKASHRQVQHTRPDRQRYPHGLRATPALR